MKDIDNSRNLKTIGDCLHALEAYFEAHNLYYGHGTDSAWDEAVALLSAVLALSPEASNEVLEQSISPEECAEILSLARQRVRQKIPVPYLVKTAWFMGLPFYVDQRVLIPRSPFAELIAECFQPWLVPEQVRRILEIGTGSGCMAIAAATCFPDAKIDATDIDADALAVAAINVDRHQLQSRVKLLQSDGYAALSGRYQLIMSNPPYVGEKEMQTLPDEYLHEPQRALQADDNGLAVVERILTGAADFLTADGILVVEVGNSAPLVAERYPRLPFVWLEFQHGGFGVFLLTAADLQHVFCEEK